MAWISYVIVVVLLYIPIFGVELARKIQSRPVWINMPFLPVAVPIPFSGTARLFIVSVVLWGALWVALNTIFKVKDVKLPIRLLCASRPYFSSSRNLAIYLSYLVLIGFVLLSIPTYVERVLSIFIANAVLRSPGIWAELLWRWVFPNIWHQFTPPSLLRLPEPTSLPISGSPTQPVGAIFVLSLLRGLINILATTPDPAVTLSIFTLVVAYFTRREPEKVYHRFIQSQQRRRKERLEKKGGE
jgi:hypothetical protein